MELLKALAIKNQFTYHKDRTQKVEQIKLTFNEEVIKFECLLQLNQFKLEMQK